MSPVRSIDTVARSTPVARVALVCLHTSPLARIGSVDAGGMNVYVLRLAEGLGDLGIKVDIFTRRHDRATPAIIEVRNGLRVVHVEGGPARHVPKKLLPLHIPSTVRSIREFVVSEDLRYDVWHSHYWLSGLAAMRVRDDPRTPVIHMFHTLFKAKERFLGFQDGSDSALRLDAERCLMTSVDAVVGATAGEAELMRDLYARSPAHFEVIPCGVDLKAFRPYDKVESRRYLKLGGERLVLFVGRVDRIKGLETLLRVVAAVRNSSGQDVRIVVLGEHGQARGTTARSYRQLAASLGIGHAVDFRGIVPHEELARYYSATDVCAVPSAYEAFGMVAIESMACQTPVVAFDVGGLSSTIEDGKTGFLARPGDEHDFVRALTEGLFSPHITAMGRQARFSMQPYDWSRITAQTLSVYERAVFARLRIGARAAGEC